MASLVQHQLVLTALLALAVPLHALSQNYARGPIPLSVEAALHYSVDTSADTISLALVVTSSSLRNTTSAAWGGLGVSESTSGSMIGADIASVTFETGRLDACKLTDRHVPFAAFPLGKTNGTARGVYPDPDKCQNDGSWTLVACSRDPTEGTLTVELKRGLQAHDEQDRNITSGAQQLIYAYGVGEFRYHGGKRGGSQVTLFEKDGSLPTTDGDVPLPSDVDSNQTILATAYTIPADKVTTYACTSLELKVPPGGNLTMVAAEHVLQRQSGPDMVHHLVVSACPRSKAFNRFLKTGDCMGDVGDMDCNSLVFAWAVGIGRWVLPDGVGLVITEKNRFISLNTHYDNPKSVKGAVDNSGIRMYFAKSRPIEAGSLTLGDAAVSLGGRVVKHDFKYQSNCPSVCTDRFEKPINIFGSFLHMHTTGKTIYTNRFDRNGNFLETINAISYWSNDHQQLTKINPPRVMNPGDQLSTTCIFDTRKASNTEFGLATADEMCMDFIFYYPVQKLQPFDNNAANCGMFQLGRRNSTKPPVTMCGHPRKESILMNLTNPTMNDTVGVPDVFGNAPTTCAAAVAAPNTQSNDTATGTGAATGAATGGGSSNSSASCFPASATVTLRTGERKRMDELQPGDEVAVGRDAYSAVFAFTHRERDTLFEFVTLHTSHGSLSLTPTHFVYADGTLVAAGEVRVGDVLQRADGSATRVMRVQRVWKYGLYNPQTLHGDIVVDGFVASTYTMEVRPKAAHALLVPLRFLGRFAGLYFAAMEHGVSEGNWAWELARGTLKA